MTPKSNCHIQSFLVIIILFYIYSISYAGNSIIVTTSITDMVLKNKIIDLINPPKADFMMGGSCMTNLFLTSKENALTYAKATPETSEKTIKPIGKVFANLLKKKKSFTHCSVCSTNLAEHENTLFSIFTKNKKRIIACCGHCGLFASWKLNDKVKSALTTDFKTGNKIDAKKALYVVNNDMVVCCFPSTISFANREDALAFEKEHGGEVMSYAEALKNINLVMKGKERE